VTAHGFMPTARVRERRRPRQIADRFHLLQNFRRAIRQQTHHLPLLEIDDHRPEKPSNGSWAGLGRRFENGPPPQRMTNLVRTNLAGP
jgi:hypothetical protein